ncbi:MAG: 2,3-bisphosphoglycerate-independent phosphoglycerate mutase [Bacteriovorax sp.]|nr:2,3-bisphosphoglycerate-independent phosphoglycerate mutase [Bacteriovorax sp.]
MKSLYAINKRVLLVILDGFGINPKDNKNAILHAKKPNIDFLFEHYPMTTIEAGGLLVGLPKGVAGNSEVGHMNLGAGKSVRQDLVRINEAIENNSLKDMPELNKLIAYAKSHSNRIHLMGLLSDGGVHSHINHLKELIKILSREGIELCLHAFMDGRDTPRDVGVKFVEEMVQIKEIKFASIQGRSIGMDRDRRWNKIKECYETIIGRGKTTTLSAPEYIQSEYKEDRYDEFITPALLDKNLAIKSDDAVFFFNYRPDRAIEITLALTDPKFDEFETPIRPGYFLCMTPYVQENVDLPILFDKEKLRGTLSEYISKSGLKQFKIAETEKYAHVTYFFNGGEKTPFPGEEQVLIPSNREIATYDEKPEMSAPQVLARLEKALADHTINFYAVNFANSDMVGHTGNFEAAVKAIEVLDECVGQLMKKCEAEKVTMLVTADHGNSDQMVYDNGDIHTSHTEAPVPFAVFDPDLKDEKLELNEGPFALKDVAPTVLNIMGLPKADNFEGMSIFK